MPEQATASPEAWVLAIEASNPSADPNPGMASVAGARLLDDGTPGDEVEVAYPAATRDRDGLLPAIEEVRTRLGVEAGSLARIFVSVGPGGYTGLRVSVTVAKSLAYATGATVVGVPSATVAIGDHRPDGPFLVCLASKGERTHVTSFADPSALEGEAVGVLDAAGLADRLVSRHPASGEVLLIADRYLPEPIRAACIQKNGRVLAPRFSATRCLHVGYAGRAVDPIALSPVYAREPEAVRLWRDRQVGKA